VLHNIEGFTKVNIDNNSLATLLRVTGPIV